jgi:hypothetical protein
MANFMSQLAHAPFATGAVAAAFIGLLYIGYRWALPKPIPGIPYNEADARTVFGTLPRLIAAVAKNNNRAQAFLASQNAELNAPLVQIWMVPFLKPQVIIADFQESQDILMRRPKEFDRASATIDGFLGVIPGHQIAMRSSDPRFKGNRELVRDIMSPQFLNDVTAAEVYKKTQNLVDLWRFKTAAITDGRPFEASHDMQDTAMDIVNAAAFAFDSDMSVIAGRLEGCRGDSGQPFADANGGVDFARASYPKLLQPLRNVAHYVGDVVQSPFPRLAHHFRILLDRKLRSDFANRDKTICGQIQQSLDRLQAGDEVQRSACDFMVQREMRIAKKEGRAPDFFSERIMHEVSERALGLGHLLICAFADKPQALWLRRRWAGHYGCNLVM